MYFWLTHSSLFFSTQGLVHSHDEWRRCSGSISSVALIDVCRLSSLSILFSCSCVSSVCVCNVYLLRLAFTYCCSHTHYLVSVALSCRISYLHFMLGFLFSFFLYFSASVFDRVGLELNALNELSHKGSARISCVHIRWQILAHVSSES